MLRFLKKIFSFIQFIQLRIKFWYWANSKKNKMAFAVISKLYADVDGAALSKQDRKSKKIERDEMVYGEISFFTLALLFDIIQNYSQNKADTKKDKNKSINKDLDGTFYDLGSGTGKAVMTAALLYPFKKACGIELLPRLHDCSLAQLETLRDLRNSSGSEQAQNRSELPDHLQTTAIQFIHADFFDIDLSDAGEGDIVFINATGFFAEAKEKLILKLQKVKPKCWVMISSKKLPQADFELIDARSWPMSWGNSMIYLYRKHHD